MIDAHCHILPGMDDGSRSVEESISMLNLEAENGITTAVLTSHFYASQNSPQKFLERRQKAWEKLKPHLTAQMPGILLGAEVQYFEGICQIPDLHDLCIQGTDLLLLEMSQQKWSERVIRDVEELQDREDMTVLLAHIERYFPYERKEDWAWLRRCGVLMQVSASYFQSWRTGHKAKKMLKAGHIQLLGSDAHNMTSRRPNLTGRLVPSGYLQESLIPEEKAYHV